MKKVKAKNKVSGKIYTFEVYTSFVYIVEQMREISKIDFLDFFEVI